MTTSDNQSPAVPSQLNHHGDSLNHHGDGQPLQNGVNSSSEESSEEEEQGSSGLESSSEEEEGELNEEAQLENAGVQIDLEALGVPQEGGVAPLHLLSEVCGLASWVGVMSEFLALVCVLLCAG